MENAFMRRLAALTLICVLGLLRFAPVTYAAAEDEVNAYNLYYAFDSNKQFKSFISRGVSEQVESITFGWASILQDEDGTLKLEYERGDFRIPVGYEEVLNQAREAGLKVYLNIYSAGPYDKLLESTPKLLPQIKDLVTGRSVEGAEFDGIVLDMEGLTASVQKNYSAFAWIVSDAIGTRDKTTILALQPARGADYGILNQFADGYILMLHDYEPKYYSLPVSESKPVVTPLAPTDRMLSDLGAELEAIGQEKLDSVWLQLNLATAQWKVKGGWITGPGGERYPYRPTYETLVQRMAVIEREDDSGFKRFEDGSPYLHYYDSADETWNTIWYEDETSFAVKMKGARDLGIGRFSVWRMGNLPEIGRYNLDMPTALGLIE